jgi:hypothetical protein
MVRVFAIDQSQRRKECNSRWLVFTQDKRFSRMGQVRCCRYSWSGQRDSVKSWVDVLFDRHSIAGCGDCGSVSALEAADARAQPSRHGDMHARGGEGRLQDGAMDSAGGQTCLTSGWRARGGGDRGTAGLNRKKSPPLRSLFNGSTRRRACPTTCSPHQHVRLLSQSWSISLPTCNFRRRHLLHHPIYPLPQPAQHPHPPCPGKVGTPALAFFARPRLTLPPAYVDQRYGPPSLPSTSSLSNARAASSARATSTRPSSATSTARPRGPRRQTSRCVPRAPAPPNTAARLCAEGAWDEQR